MAEPKHTTIYGLCEPRLDHPLYGQVRYVGKTIYTPEARLQGHLLGKNKAPVTTWIAKLKAVGLIPTAIALEVVCPEDCWKARERHWILHYRGLGKLLNCTHGGEGPFGGALRSPETIAKIIAFHTGRKASPEARANMRAAHLGKSFMTDEEKARRSARMKGTRPPASMPGRKKSAEHILKISLSNIKTKKAQREAREALAIARGPQLCMDLPLG